MILKVKYNMNKRIIYLLLLMAMPFTALCNNIAGTQFLKANEFYKKANYKEAAAIYQQMANGGYQSSPLYYNLGNAYYKTGDIALAILYYEKAKKLNPGDEDINSNIQLANLKTTDKTEEIPEFFISKWWHAIILAFSVNTLALFSVVFILAAFLILILYRFSNAIVVKKVSFYAAMVLLLLGICTILIANRQVKYFEAHHQAIVFNSTVTIKSAPSNSSKNLFVLHEGSKVNILDKSGNWAKISLANGTEGWIGSADIREI